MKKFEWLKILNSPFKPFSIKWYIGKTRIGVPYFYPRKWIKNKEKPGYLKPIPLKVGFDYCGLGWKTKWTNTDFRYEWGPVFTFVFFGYQIAAMVGFRDKEAVHAYWEAWLCYEYATDKTKSKAERIAECRKIMPQIWDRYTNGNKETIDYYERILKPKYLSKK